MQHRHAFSQVAQQFSKESWQWVNVLQSSASSSLYCHCIITKLPWFFELCTVHSAINFLKNVPYLMPVVFSNNFGTNQSGFIWESF